MHVRQQSLGKRRWAGCKPNLAGAVPPLRHAVRPWTGQRACLGLPRTSLRLNRRPSLRLTRNSEVTWSPTNLTCCMQVSRLLPGLCSTKRQLADCHCTSSRARHATVGSTAPRRSVFSFPDTMEAACSRDQSVREDTLVDLSHWKEKAGQQARQVSGHASRWKPTPIVHHANSCCVKTFK